MALIFISLMRSDVEHLLLCLLAVYMSFLGKCLFRSFALFLIELYVALLLNIERTTTTLDTKSLSARQLENVLSDSLGCLFTLLTVSLDAQRF